MKCVSKTKAEVRCSGYILKPVTTEQIAKELLNLRYPVERKTDSEVYVQCFGNFEVFVNKEALHFDSAKTKELFAYLVDRNGAVCSNGEIIAALWDDDGDHYSYLKKCKKDLINVLTKVGCENIIVSHWGSIGVNREKFTCDYYQWLDGTANGINAYHGEYMLQYFGDNSPCNCGKCSSCVVDEQLYDEEVLSAQKKKSAAKALEMAGLSEQGMALFALLRTERAEIAKEQGVPPFIICSDKSLKDICIKLPKEM